MPLPTFIIGGERRSGTTALYYWLRDHAAIHLYPQPDMDYFIEAELFSKEWVDGPADASRWQREHSVDEYSDLFQHNDERSVIGQKDADLLFWKPTHKRIASYLPECRFVFVLRDPVDRAWSHYWNEFAKGRETLSFEDALAGEEARSRTSDYAKLHLGYVQRGYYELSLTSFFQHIAPSNTLVVTLEEAQSEPNGVLNKVFTFIGVDPLPTSGAVSQRFNENAAMLLRPWVRGGGLSRLERLYDRAAEAVVVRLFQDKQRRLRARTCLKSIFRYRAGDLAMPIDIRSRLHDLYDPHIDALESMLDRKFTVWRK